MEIFIKLYDLLKTYPWRNFGCTIVFLLLGLLILMMINHRKVDKWLQKFKLLFTVGLSGILLITSIIFIIFLTFFFQSWISEIGRFNAIEDYIINIFLLLSFSLLFGIIGYLIHLATSTAYKLDNISPEDYFQSSVKRHLQAVEKAEREVSLLSGILDATNGELAVKFLGYLGIVAQEKIRSKIETNSYLKDRAGVEVYQIIGLPIYHVYFKSTPSPHMPMPPMNFFVTDNDFLYLENKLLVMYPDLYFHFSDAVTNRSSHPKEYEKIKRIISAEIEHIQKAVIPGYNEFYNGKHVKLKVFLYAYLIQALNFNQNYVVPLISIAKFNQIVFALFRLLMQGTFLGLVIKNILKP